MSDVNVFLVMCSVVMAVIVNISGKRVVAAEKDVKRWALRCKHATARANRRGRELRARDVACRRKKAAKQNAPALTWDEVEAVPAAVMRRACDLLVSSR